MCNSRQFMVSGVSKCGIVVDLWARMSQSVLWSIYGLGRLKSCNCRQFMVSGASKCVAVVNVWSRMSQRV